MKLANTINSLFLFHSASKQETIEIGLRIVGEMKKRKEIGWDWGFELNKRNSLEILETGEKPL